MRNLTLPPRFKTPLLVAAGLVAVLAIAAIVRLVQYDGVAKPGVRVLGVDVGGKSRAQIISLVDEWDAHPVTISVGHRSYHVQRGWLVSVDAAATAKRALSAGSTFALVSAKRIDIEPALGRATSANNVLKALAEDNREAISATVRLRGTHVAVTQAHAGRRLDQDRLLSLLEHNQTAVEAPFSIVKPQVTNAEGGRSGGPGTGARGEARRGRLPGHPPREAVGQADCPRRPDHAERA